MSFQPYFDLLSNEEFLSVCDQMPLDDLKKFVQTDRRAHQVCQKLLNEKFKEKRIEELVQEALHATYADHLVLNQDWIRIDPGREGSGREERILFNILPTRNELKLLIADDNLRHPLLTEGQGYATVFVVRTKPFLQKLFRYLIDGGFKQGPGFLF